MAYIETNTGHYIALVSQTANYLSMANRISTWSPYEGRTSIVSGGRGTLTSAFANLVVSRQGFQSYKLPEIFAASPDESENDAARDFVRLEAEHMSRKFASGRLASFVRSLGGDEVTAITPELWEFDDPLARFATGAISLARENQRSPISCRSASAERALSRSPFIQPQAIPLFNQPSRGPNPPLFSLLAIVWLKLLLCKPSILWTARVIFVTSYLHLVPTSSERAGLSLCEGDGVCDAAALSVSMRSSIGVCHAASSAFACPCKRVAGQVFFSSRFP